MKLCIFKYKPGRLLLLSILIFSLTSCRKPPNISKETGSSKTTKESTEESETSSEETASEESIEESGSEGESSASQEYSIPESEETESVISESESDSSQAGTKAETEFESDETTVPVITYLESVEALPAGTVLKEAELDSENPEKYFTVTEITESSDIFKRINGKSYRKETSIALSNLRYVKLIHRNYEGKPQVGEIIINKSIASDFVEIFEELYRQNYEIYSMYLVDDFWTGNPNDSDAASMNANNTSSFNDRTVDYSGGTSRHSYGTAIDINPRENPYVLYDQNGNPYTTQEDAGADYIDRSVRRPHMMYDDDLCVRLFKERGFRWGGDWSSLKDYQHFDKSNSGE